MGPMIWMLRMVRWARHPPSASRVALVLSVVALAVAVVVAERLGWWPDWATLDRPPGRIRLQH